MKYTHASVPEGALQRGYKRYNFVTTLQNVRDKAPIQRLSVADFLSIARLTFGPDALRVSANLATRAPRSFLLPALLSLIASVALPAFLVFSRRPTVVLPTLSVASSFVRAAPTLTVHFKPFFSTDR